MNGSRIAIAVLVAAILVGLAALVWVLARPSQETADRRAASEASRGVGRLASARRGADRAPGGDAAAADAASSRPRRITPEQRRALAEAIERARRLRVAHEEASRGQAGGAGPSEGDGGASEPVGTLSREYIRETIGEAIPLIRECYELALAEQPGLSGRVRVRFVIAGEPDVAGLVEEARVEPEEGMAPSSTLDECLTQTVLSLEFPPPEGGGVVRVTYPLRFSSAAPDAGERGD